MGIDVRDAERNDAHRVALLRLIGEERITIPQLARSLNRSEQAVYRMLQGHVAGKWWLPAEVGRLAGAEAFAAVSCASAVGVICVDAPAAGGPTRANDIARLALELGGDVGLVQAAIARATSPDSPGGVRIVGTEELDLRRALEQLQRAAASLEQVLAIDRVGGSRR